MLQVPSSILSPNLHIAVCRFGDQERARGLIANETELWVERAMNGPKPRGRRALHAEKTYVKAMQTMARALTNCQVRMGCKTDAEHKQALLHSNQVLPRDPASSAGIAPYFLMTGRLCNSKGASLPNGVRDAQTLAVVLAESVRKAQRRELRGWQGMHINADNWMDQVQVTCFRECRLDAFTASTPARGNSDKVAASSWVLTLTRKGNVLLHLLSFLLVESIADQSAAPLRVVVAHASDAWVQDDLGGAMCYKAPSAAETYVTSIPVERLHMPCILLKPGDKEDSDSRLLPLSGKRL
jgi:hypothetical protein